MIVAVVEPSKVNAPKPVRHIRQDAWDALNEKAKQELADEFFIFLTRDG